MKKVAGTLKLDQAEYRELEAFAKFGSDLDAATQSVLNKGIRNVEILKQGQYTPMPVEKQIAIIYCGTKGLLKEIPVYKVREFEKEFLDKIETEYSEILDQLGKGELNDEITNTLEQVASEVSSKYKEY
jgi:F-type H+-transporting ATPase subunit alpha